MNTSSARPATPRIVYRPVLATVGLHALVIFFLTANWTLSDERLVKPKPAPKVINATLVTLSEAQPQPAPKPEPLPVAKPEPPKPEAKPPPPKPAPKPEPPKPEPPKPEPPKPAPKPEPKPPPKPEPKQQPKGPTAQELAEQARQETARREAAAKAAAQAAQAARAAAASAELSASYASLIRQTVEQRWSRPPTARNGMEVLLSIQLIPTGEVVSVSVLRSSGDTAFDHSAVAAVERAGNFPELKNLPPREFEQNFRRFRLLFRPEDLRY